MRTQTNSGLGKGHAQGLVLGSLLFTLLLFLAACQPVQAPAVSASSVSATAEIPNVVITASDTAFDVPAEIPAGLVSLTLENVGESNHHAIILQVEDDVTLQQVRDMLEQPEDQSSNLSDQQAVVVLPDTDPGDSNQATLDLPSGHWVIFSVSMDESMTPDFAKGMLNEFRVTDGDQPAAAQPVADLTITLSDDDFDMPAELSAGQYTVQVTNAGSANDGYLFFLKLGGDTTIDDILAAFDTFFAGSMPEKMPEFLAVGGLMGNSVSKTFWTTLDLEPGNYVAISNIGIAEDFPYSGLAKNFTVK